MKKLTTNFFYKSALEVGPELLGKLIVKKSGSSQKIGRIIETEAYVGEEDKACHARHGKTKRNAPMYEDGGLVYVYLCYGIHNLLNIVTGRSGNPEAVLIRKIRTDDGRELGPGGLTKFLEIDRTHNGKGLGEEIYIADDGYMINEILQKERVGIDYAEEYRDKLWRFVAK